MLGVYNVLSLSTEYSRGVVGVEGKDSCNYSPRSLTLHKQQRGTHQSFYSFSTGWLMLLGYKRLHMWLSRVVWESWSLVMYHKWLKWLFLLWWRGHLHFLFWTSGEAPSLSKNQSRNSKDLLYNHSLFRRVNQHDHQSNKLSRPNFCKQKIKEESACYAADW